MRNDWRLILVKAAMVLLFTGLLVRIGYLQLYLGEKYNRQSSENRLRVEEIDPVRGLIYDRKGRLLVENRPGYTVMGIVSALSNNSNTFQKLDSILDGGNIVDWRSLIEKKSNRRPEIRLKRDIKFNQLAAIEASMIFLPGINVKVESQRYYPYQTATHILGYPGEISLNELEAFKGFQAGDIVGKKGIERSLNSLLFGQRGFKVIEVDAVGNKIREVEGLKDNIPSVNGNDVYLTIDLDIQRYAEQLLDGKNGAIVAIDPTNGDILAMASTPSYDPAIFTGVLHPEEWNDVINNPDKPLLNRAIQGTYPPGSAIKMAILAAGIEEGIVTENEKIVCPGYLMVGNRPFKCWNQSGHGAVNARQAVERSCDVYFYTLGLELGIDRMAKYLRAFGFGSSTGIDIDGENSGLIPDSDYMNRRFGKGNWTLGNLSNIAIGQGDVLVTPLQLATFCAALANSGYLVKPHIFRGTVNRNPDYWIGNQPELKKIEGISEKTMNLIREGMFLVVQGEHGTAKWLANPNVQIAGKTGTAQNPHGEDHALFIGFAPYDNPTIAVSAIVEHGEHGSSMAAPIVVKIIQKYLQLSGIEKTPAGIRTVG